MESYNIDHTITSIPTSLLRQNINDIFFETGTNTGKAVEVAINCGFRKIISIDIEKKYFENAKNNFTSEKYKGVSFEFYLGDSSEVIKKILPNLKSKITFWLDGHSIHQVPLIEELKTIKDHYIKDHTILIDDVNMFDSSEWNCIGHQTILDHILDINPEYSISYHDSVYGKKTVLLSKIN